MPVLRLRPRLGRQLTTGKPIRDDAPVKISGPPTFVKNSLNGWVLSVAEIGTSPLSHGRVLQPRIGSPEKYRNANSRNPPVLVTPSMTGSSAIRAGKPSL